MLRLLIQIQLSLLSLGAKSYIIRSVEAFGNWQRVPHLTEVVLDLSDASLRASSRNTYRTGQRAYDRFMVQMARGQYYPFEPRALQDTELNLAFFMAFLLLEPKIKAAGTILNYETHVKFSFKEEGCREELFTTPFLKCIRRGVKNTLPSKRDKRSALLLPLLLQQTAFQSKVTNTDCLLRFATIIGFVGMLRPHTLAQLYPNSLTLVTFSGKCYRLPKNRKAFKSALYEARVRGGILGFYYTFQSKTMREAQAYFPSLCTMSKGTKLSAMCPVKALIDIANRELASGNFLKTATKSTKLAAYLKLILDSNTTVAPYALRIGGRTWKISQGMDRQMVDFLGRWKSSEASARYFRGNPRAVLLIVRRFYLDNDPSMETLRRGGARG